METKRKSIISLLLLLVMVSTCAVLPNKLTAYATEKELLKQSEPATEEGDLTKVTAKVFAQNTTSDWTWMNLDDVASLLYKTKTELNALNPDNVFADANSSANFGLQVTDENLLAEEGSKLTFYVGTITIKADGYDDLIINLDKEYKETYLAEEVSWGFQGNDTMIILNDYLPSNESDKADFIQKISQVTADITLSDYEFIPAIIEGPEFPEDYTYPTTMRGLSPMELVEDLEVGWNLGNTLEAEGGETNWGNPKTKRKMIDAIKASGFSSVRIPVRWDENYIDDNYTIDPEFMDRVETVVNYALVNDMYAIINIHHNELQGQVNEQSKAKVLNELDAIWTQVASNFKDYGDQLIFETINEPRNAEDWTGNTSLYQIVNEYNEKALNTIRLTGGNNATRLVMLPTYAASADYDKIMGMEVPDDDNVAVSLHSYTPYDFALNTAPGSQSTFAENDKRTLDNLFSLINNTFVEKGIAVVLGEFAATDKDNLDDRVEYAYYYSQAAAKYNIPVFWWDNGNFAEGEAMGIFNRRNLEFEYPDILQALMDGWYSEKEDPDIDPEDPEEPEDPENPSTELPSVTVATEHNHNSISQKYTISAEGGDVDLSKLKIVYTSPGMSREDHNVWCHHAGLVQDTPDWYYQLTDSVNCNIDEGSLNITIDRSIVCPETGGIVTLNLQFAKTDWSYYGELADQVLKVYYDGVLVQ